MSCQGDDSTEETPPGAGHLGASHARFKSSVSWLVGAEGCKTGVNVPCQSCDRGASTAPRLLALHFQSLLILRGWGQSSTLALHLLPSCFLQIQVSF